MSGREQGQEEKEAYLAWGSQEKADTGELDFHRNSDLGVRGPESNEGGHTSCGEVNHSFHLLTKYLLRVFVPGPVQGKGRGKNYSQPARFQELTTQQRREQMGISVKYKV